MQDDSPGKAVTFQITFCFFLPLLGVCTDTLSPSWGYVTRGGVESVTKTSNGGRNIFKAIVLTKKTISNSMGTSKDSERQLC